MEILLRNGANVNAEDVRNHRNEKWKDRETESEPIWKWGFEKQMVCV